MEKIARTTIRVQPLTLARWPDLEAIFAAPGCSDARWCGCMFYRQSGKLASDGAVNRAALRALAEKADPAPGLIAYRGKMPVGWVSLGPRADFAKLKRSPVMKAVDDKPVWSVICFVVPSEFRGQGVAKALLAGASAFAKKNGATLLEAYPVDKHERSEDTAMWFGPKSMYDAAGFQEVARRKPTRPVMRLSLQKSV